MCCCVHAASLSTAPLLRLCPVFSRAGGPQHHLHLHPAAAPARRWLQPRPPEELPPPGPVSPGSAPARRLHLPPHRSQVPLHLQPARPLQHISGSTQTAGLPGGIILPFIRRDFGLILKSMSGDAWKNDVLAGVTPFSISNKKPVISGPSGSASHVERAKLLSLISHLNDY